MFTPVVNPLTPLVGLAGVVTVPVPAVTVHNPVPTVGVLPASVAAGLQIVWSIPAVAVVGSWSTLMVIVSVLAIQVPLLMVHTNVFTPVVKPVTPLVGDVGAVTVAVPAVTVQTPVPTVGVLPTSVAVGLQIV